jgi:outer membrane lipoprotein-sorting protein
MNKHILVFLISALVFPFCVSAQVKGFKAISDETAFRKKFSQTANATQSIKSDFIQEKNLNILSEKITSKGKFLFKKQNMVKMEYLTPFKYLLVINKDKVTIKDDKKSNSFSSKSNKLFENINKLVIDCVQGTALNSKDFTSSVQESDKEYLLVLVPNKKEMKSYFNKINIYIDKKDYSVNKMDMLEPSGDNTLITFINKQYNIAIADAEFVVK